MNKYQVIALIGKSSAGKDTIQTALCQQHPLMFHKLVSCTTRPKRDTETEGVEYNFISIENFTRKVLNGDMLEATEFRDWFYGTPIDALDAQKINIGVFNPAGVEALIEDPRLDVMVIEVTASDKTRLLRSLNREENPDCAEVCRRYFADEKDFVEFDFATFIVNNDTGVNWYDELHNNELFLDQLEERWTALEPDIQFSTAMRWEESLRTKAEIEVDKDKIE